MPTTDPSRRQTIERRALDNLTRIAREIDPHHLACYSPREEGETDAATATRFLNAVKLEYRDEPTILERRMEVLASMVFVAAPDSAADGPAARTTPFHGLDQRAFDALVANEDFVYRALVEANGDRKTQGVRPFSVCETKFLIAISKGDLRRPFVSDRRITDFAAYASAYASHAQSCDPRDHEEWYNFRGLGCLRPSWLESNFNDRIIRRMLTGCAADPPAAMKQACVEFAQDRLAFRMRRTAAFALRQMVFDTRPESQLGGSQDGDYMCDPKNVVIFVEDGTGDGVAEFLVPGPVELVPKATLLAWPPPGPPPSGTPTAPENAVRFTVSDDGERLIGNDGRTLGLERVTLAVRVFGERSDLALTLETSEGTWMSDAPTGAVRPIARVDPAWKAELADTRDLGLAALFSGGEDAGSNGESRLRRRFRSLIDRHEHLYASYTSTDPTSSALGNRPSPLVACSTTLGAAHRWDDKGVPEGGRAGFVFLTRIPFKAIVAGDARGVDTLSVQSGEPTRSSRVSVLDDLVAARELDLGTAWLDVATLSSNLFPNEHEISAFGAVAAEQIEGILVVRRPAAMGD